MLIMQIGVEREDEARSEGPTVLQNESTFFAYLPSCHYLAQNLVPSGIVGGLYLCHPYWRPLDNHQSLPTAARDRC